MERSEKWLAEHRVLEGSRLEYHAEEMTPDERLARRSYIRRILKDYPEWCNLANERIDQMLVCSIENGFLIEDQNGYEYLVQSKGVSRAETEFRKVRAMMPFEFMDLTGTDFEWTRYRTNISAEKDMVNKFILKFPQFKEKGMGLYIYSGTKGSGKTMLSCCILNEISKRYPGSVKFVNTLDFLEMTKKGFQGMENEVNALYEAELLVIDDIGVQMSKDWVDTVFYRLINARYTNRLPTIYTSNLHVEDLRMDDRITDRIESTTFLIQLPEESVRKAKRQQDKDKLLNQIENGPKQCGNADQGQA